MYYNHVWLCFLSLGYKHLSELWGTLCKHHWIAVQILEMGRGAMMSQSLPLWKTRSGYQLPPSVLASWLYSSVTTHGSIMVLLIRLKKNYLVISETDSCNVAMTNLELTYVKFFNFRLVAVFLPLLLGYFLRDYSHLLPCWILDIY